MGSRIVTLLAVALGLACTGGEGGFLGLADKIGARSEPLAPFACEAEENTNGEVTACDGGLSELRPACITASATARNRRLVAQTFVADVDGAPGRVRLVARLAEALPVDDLTSLEVEIFPVSNGYFTALPELAVARGSYALNRLNPGEDVEISVVLNAEQDFLAGETYALLVQIPSFSEAEVGLACLASGDYAHGEVWTRELRRVDGGKDDFDGPPFSIVEDQDLAFVVTIQDGCKGGLQTCGVGVCHVEMPVCVDGVPQDCVPGTPTEEICDGLDNDCDGIIDNLVTDEPEPLTRSCYTGPEGTEGVGRCSAGTQVCVAEPGSGVAAWSEECEGEVHPAEVEVCNGIDDTCDGRIDEIFNADTEEWELLSQTCYTGPEGTENVGQCHGGVQYCVNGEFEVDAEGVAVCHGETVPGPRLCNGLDNDCDGSIDVEPADEDDGPLEDGEGNFVGDTCIIPGLIGQCAVGRYVCTETGIECEQVHFPSEEICDGLDNDCDGIVDNATPGLNDVLTQSCYTGDPETRGVGQCADGVQQCVDGAWEVDGEGVAVCAGQVLPTAEVCDGFDNDCDGFVDNAETGAPDLIQQACYTGPEGTEGVGLCRSGLETCVATVGGGNAEWGECEGEITPQDEVCDGYDNDCDGHIDEIYNEETGQMEVITQPYYTGPAGTADVGICQAGIQVCAALQGEEADGLPAWEVLVPEILPDEAEICDGLDNDCDGFVDNQEPGVEDLMIRNCYTGPEGTRGVGQCSDGIQTCMEGAWALDDEGNPVCVGEVLPTDRPICNGLDNDCDGNIDTDALDDGEGNYVGETCTVPGLFGRCAIGQWVCTETGIVCEQVTFPTEEICNGYDNDCDGFVGNVGDGDPTPLTRSCYTGPEGTEGVGECQSGISTCMTDVNEETGVAEWGSCDGEVTPRAEVCDGLDNNCDGFTDNEVAGVADLLTRPYYTGPEGTADIGICKTGTEICAGVVEDGVGVEKWDVLIPEVLPDAQEVCDGLDNTCNGLTDTEDPAIFRPQCENQTGVCAGSLKPDALCMGEQGWAACDETVYSAHSADFGAEVCDGLDNDCDGQTDAEDQDLVRPQCEKQDGVCAGSEKPAELCQDGQWAACGSAEYEAHSSDYGAEICDGLDNDCDGQADLVFDDDEQQYVPLTRVCYSGPEGTRNQGICSDGLQYCVHGEWPEGNEQCIGEVLPEDVDVCDGLDNDCDGFVDNAVPGEPEVLTRSCYTGPAGTRDVGICESGVHSCNAEPGSGEESWGTCEGEVHPEEKEVCDGLDNDCDGHVDNHVPGLPDPMTRTCYTGDPTTRGVGRCSDGVQTCTDGEWPLSCPGQVLPGIETCNGIDDDCDGYTDNAVTGSPQPLTRACYSGEPTTRGVGVCSDGLQTCEDGTYGETCPGEVLPGTEICDGKDNNCDGQTDEGYGAETCGHGVCQRTIQQCVAGVPQQCIPDWSKQTNEVCNGLDDNCDGQVDNADINAMCPRPPNVAETVCGGASGCSIGQCAVNYHDLDGVYGNGCECLDDVFASVCSQASQVATLNQGGTYTGEVAKLPYSGDSDWYVVRFPSQIARNTRQAGKPRIWLDPNPQGAFRIEVRTSCSALYGGCPANVTEWSREDTCDSGGVRDCWTRSTPWNDAIYVRVYRVSGGNTCDAYRLRASR